MFSFVSTPLEVNKFLTLTMFTKMIRYDVLAVKTTVRSSVADETR